MLHFTYNHKYAALRINTLSLYAGNTAQATDEIKFQFNPAPHKSIRIYRSRRTPTKCAALCAAVINGTCPCSSDLSLVYHYALPLSRGSQKVYILGLCHLASDYLAST